MTTMTTQAPVAALKPKKQKSVFGSGRFLNIYTWLVIVWLAIPIPAMILFGFNNTTGRLNNTWQGFTFKWYQHLFAIQDLTVAFEHSIEIAIATTVIAGLVGTLVGLALGKHRFRGQGVANIILFAAIASPEIVMGASLHSQNIQTGINEGFLTVLIAHVMFSLSFVAVTVRARVMTLDPALDEAARDLGAGPWTTFRLVTIPMILPGIMSGALLAFVLSIDDVITTTFVNGSNFNTYPLYIYGASKIGLPPQVNVMGTLIFGVGLLLAVVNALAARRRS